MVDTLKDIGPGDVIVTPELEFKVYKLDHKPRKEDMVKLKDRHGTHFVQDALWVNKATICSRFQVFRVDVKTVPTNWRGPAGSKDVDFRILTLFSCGDQDTYHEWLFNHGPWRGLVDLSKARVKPNLRPLKAIGDLSGLVKMDLICSVIMAFGPSSRDDILRRVSAMEGKPWVTTSNWDYFSSNRQGAIEEHSEGRRGKTLYRCTIEGLKRGSVAMARFGLEAILAIDKK